MEDVITEIIGFFPILKEDEYKKQFSMLYGALDKTGVITDEMKASIILIKKTDCQITNKNLLFLRQILLINTHIYIFFLGKGTMG